MASLVHEMALDMSACENESMRGAQFSVMWWGTGLAKYGSHTKILNNIKVNLRAWIMLLVAAVQNKYRHM